MELRHLRYFVTVAEESHFGRAAARLHVTQSNLSTQVQALEREVGGPVFRRTSRRVELTEAGALLLVEARRVLAQADRALDLARTSVRGEVGSVHIGFSGVAVLQGVLPHDLRRFHHEHPAVELHLTELPPTVQVQGVRDGTLDVGYSPGFSVSGESDLILTRRGEWPLSIAVHHDHPLVGVSRVAPEDLVNEDLIVIAADQDDQSVLIQLGPPLEGRRQGVRFVNGTLGVLALAAAGAGVAIVPSATERITLPGIVYRPLHQPGPGLDIVTISRPDEQSGAVRAFLGHTAVTRV